MTLEIILRLHGASLARYGGGAGIRDRGSIEAALARPYASFDGTDLYPTAMEKAAAIGESLILNHPFVDGNKRIGLLAMLYILDQAGLRLDAPEEALYDFIIAIATGQMPFEKVVAWLQDHSRTV